MACREWKDEWVATLYGELDATEEGELSEHLARCADCRATLGELGAVRSTLQASAAVELAPPPRVLVLDGRRRHPISGLAAGLAASLLVFVSGLYVGGRLPGRGDVAQGAQPDARPVSEVATRNDVSRLEARLASLEQSAAASDAPQPNAVTEAALRAEMDRLARKMRGERARDMEFLLDEITATEWRAGKWIDETREAVRYVALRDDGRLSER